MIRRVWKASKLIVIPTTVSFESPFSWMRHLHSKTEIVIPTCQPETPSSEGRAVCWKTGCPASGSRAMRPFPSLPRSPLSTRLSFRVSLQSLQSSSVPPKESTPPPMVLGPCSVAQVMLCPPFLTPAYPTPATPAFLPMWPSCTNLLLPQGLGTGCPFRRAGLSPETHMPTPLSL